VIDTFGGKTSESQDMHALSQAMIDKIYAAAQPGAVFSAPVVAGSNTIITASEVAAGGGFGFGSGSGARPGSSAGPAFDQPNASGQAAPASRSGGGGGGGSSGRPVAAIVIGPDGVKVEPIVDPTKIALAAIGAWLSIALLLVRRARRS